MQLNPENLLHRLVPTQKCTLGCPVLDSCLGGGIPCESITELVAESGCGKTQLCLQLALSAQLPFSLGGLSASSLYLHTEYPFPSRRLQQISLSFCNLHPDIKGNPCDRIYVHPLHSADQLFDIMPRIESFITESKTQMPIRLILIDSIAALFRSEFDNTPFDLKRRSSLFFKISGKLKSLARRFGLAVVVTNQVVDVMGGSEGMNGLKIGNLGSLYSSGRRVCPALGLAWANCVNSRFFLCRKEEIVVQDRGVVEDDNCDSHSSETRRQLYVLFAPHLPESSCSFVIRKEGVFGVDS